jgi:hypothetical protein
MIIEVKVKDRMVSVSVGDGKQTFKWLASVVQARIQQYGVLKSRFEDDNYIVTEVRNRSGELIYAPMHLYTYAPLHLYTYTPMPPDPPIKPTNLPLLYLLYYHTTILLYYYTIGA